MVVRDCSITGSNSATYGVYVDSPEWILQGYQTGPQLINTDIGGFSTGTAVHLSKRTEVSVSGGNIQASKWGIVCEGESSVSVSGDAQRTIFFYCTTGIETRDGSEATLVGGNTISNCTRGVYAKGTSSPTVRNTIFSQNYLYAVEATSQAAPDLGTMSDPGFNSFSSSSPCGSYRHVKAKLRYPGMGPVMAEKNWWGSDPPSPDCFSAGTVDYTPWLAGDPNEARSRGVVQMVLGAIPARAGQNFPNPFRDVTSIVYSVPKAGARALIQVFDVKGRLVRTLVDRPHDMGRHTVRWDGLDDRGQQVVSGVYFCRIQIGDDFRQTKKMILGR